MNSNYELFVLSSVFLQIGIYVLWWKLWYESLGSIFDCVDLSYSKAK